MADKVEIYRLHRGIKNGSASWGESTLFETFEALEQAVYETLVDVKVNGDWRSPDYRKFSTWRNKVMEKEGGSSATKLFSVQKLVDGEWKDLHVDIDPPRLVWVDMVE